MLCCSEVIKYEQRMTSEKGKADLRCIIQLPRALKAKMLCSHIQQLWYITVFQNPGTYQIEVINHKMRIQAITLHMRLRPLLLFTVVYFFFSSSFLFFSFLLCTFIVELVVHGVVRGVHFFFSGLYSHEKGR